VTLVRNAADSKQVRHAARKERKAVDIEREQMGEVLATVAGRAVFWRLLGALGYGQALDALPADRVVAAAGRQGGMWMLLAQITDAMPDALHLMAREARAAEDSASIEAEAVRTPSAADHPGDEE
jgi:hypothetical protein